MNRFAYVAGVALLLLPIESAALACTQEDARATVVAQEKAHRKMKKVQGTYALISSTKQTGVSNRLDGGEVEITTYLGKITTKRGKVYLTRHQDDGYFLLCGGADQPNRGAAGVFFLSKRPSAGSGLYELLDWDGDYSAALPSDEPKQMNGAL